MSVGMTDELRSLEALDEEKFGLYLPKATSSSMIR